MPSEPELSTIYCTDKLRGYQIYSRSQDDAWYPYLCPMDDLGEAKAAFSMAKARDTLNWEWKLVGVKEVALNNRRFGAYIS